jgi:hypothetical protein
VDFSPGVRGASPAGSPERSDGGGDLPFSKPLWQDKGMKKTTDKSSSGPPILRVSYGLTLLLHTRVNSFPRQHRFSLGQELTQQSLALTLALVGGNAETSSAARLTRLETASTTLAVIRITLRLAYDLRCFSAKEHAHILSSLEDVGRQLAGWIDYTRKLIK